jgi:hypothetical protein
MTFTTAHQNYECNSPTRTVYESVGSPFYAPTFEQGGLASPMTYLDHHRKTSDVEDFAFHLQGTQSNFHWILPISNRVFH